MLSSSLNVHVFGSKLPKIGIILKNSYDNSFEKNRAPKNLILKNSCDNYETKSLLKSLFSNSQ